MDEVGKFIGLLFLDRDLAHKEHLRVSGPGSLAKHEAFGGFYSAVVDLADKFAECHQGFTEQLIDVQLQSADSQDARSAIRQHGAWIRANREKICQGNSTLLNILDEVLALYYHTNYKLKFLA